MTRRLHLFEGVGVEIEYMIVNRETLDVAPLADRLLQQSDGSIVSEVEHGRLSWSNELALHVIEVKTNGPVATLNGLADEYQSHVRQMHELLAPLGARLMPTAMHPWMDPHRELELWGHEYNAVYEAYNRIFDCRGHGWANLQSVHLNLPFANDDEFGRLHAAIRLVLPLLPALAASSPIMDGRVTGVVDNRMAVYRDNSAKIPSISGRIVPEAAFSRTEYEEQVFKPMYADIMPFDTDQILQHEWLNSRGAIARFDRGSIEIRVLDSQECPRADIAICQSVVQLLQAMVNEKWSPLASQQKISTEFLGSQFLEVVHTAEQAMVCDPQYLQQFGLSEPCTAGDIWRSIDRDLNLRSTTDEEVLGLILSEGPLSRRIMQHPALTGDFSHEALHTVYAQLCDCLVQDALFRM